MKSLLTNPRWRLAVAILVIAATTIIFVRFFVLHPQYWQTLTHVPASTIAWIVVLNIAGLLTLVGINNCLLRFCGAKLGWLEQFQLTSVSAIANFFGPFQSGPGVRAVYLKAKHGVRLRDYTYASLVYYAIFAAISAVFLFGFSWPWWQAVLALVVVIAVGWLVIRRFQSRVDNATETGFRIDGTALATLILLTLAQVIIIALWYFVELKAVAAGTTFHQTLVYTGAANFALFVSLTPDAIGFREAFLVFSQHLHHISTASIVSANLLDRAVYAAFLGGLFLLTLATHARERIRAVAAPNPAERQ